ncbi:MAG: flavin-nucleotide-binding protein [Caulobacterales bacterium 32-69-10]|nr:MAG: flavin-nucleotide-binding protein [Caulobacterales bacterium 32-69-10]
MEYIATVEELEARYGVPLEASTVKESDLITPHYRALIEASPFVALATVGPEGLDCSPRGDAGSVVRIADERTLLLPDWRGNDRIDSLHNVVRDPRVALLFLIPGSGTTMRVNGQARLSAEPDLLASFEVGGKAPRTVMVIAVDTVFFQCARAVVRSRLWDSGRQVGPKGLPTPGRILASMSEERVGGDAYDAAWPERASRTLW